MNQPTHRRTISWMRHPVLGVLFTLSMTTLMLSSGHAFAGDKPKKPAPTEDNAASKEVKLERPAFDLTYLPSDAMGVAALRPHAIFGDPAMKPLAAMANKGLEQLLHFFQLSADPKLAVEDIEQIIGNFTFVPGDKKRGGTHSLIASLILIRTTRDFDWMKLMRQLDPKLEEVHQEGHVYYRSHFPKVIACMSPKATFRFILPDKRTIAFLVGTDLPTFLKDGSIQRPHFSWDKNWKQVEHGLIAVAMDNRWAHGLTREQLGDDLGVAFLFQDSVRMVAGVDWKHGLVFQAYLTGRDRTASDHIVKNIKEGVSEMRSYLKQPLPEDFPECAIPMVKGLWENVRVRRTESTVRVQTKATISLADVVKFIQVMAVQQQKP